MISPIRNWVSNLSSYASSYSKTPSTSKSGPDTPIHLVRDRALSMLETDRSKILSEVSATTVENLNKQLNNVSKKIYTLSRSWFSFLYKGHIQELLEKRHRIIDSLSEAKDIVEQELLENFKDNFRNTTSNTPTACAQSLEKIIENDPTKAFEIFLSEAQSDPKRAASILLANPISLKKIFNPSTPLRQIDDLSPKQLQTLIDILKQTLPKEIEGESEDSLFGTDTTITIPLFRLISTKILEESLPTLRKSFKHTSYWQELKSSLSKSELSEKERNFFRTFRDAIHNKLHGDLSAANDKFVSILANHVLTSSFYLVKGKPIEPVLAKYIMKTVHDFKDIENIADINFITDKLTT